MSGSSPRDRSSHSSGLLLRVRRSDGQLDEFYLAPGLTIGRTLANTIALPDDPTVDRTHARVEIAADGAATLRCVEPVSVLITNRTTVRELALDAGVRFQIGGAAFECVSGQRGVDSATLPTGCTCPYCASTAVATAGAGSRRCPACRKLVLPVPLDPQSTHPVLVPVDYHDFRASRFITRGGMGLVLQGVCASTSESVAIKVILPGTIGGGRDAELFEREVATMTRVRHPNVVKLLDHGRSGRFPFLVLEWIDGPSLRQVIADAGRTGKPTDFATAFRWFEQVCKGLASIHAVGLVHRDLKPSNVLVGPDGVARIADFGIAKQLDARQTAYTTTGHAPGTFAYMAPEQWNAPDTVDGRADLYALGVTFYELLTGARPAGAWRPASEINPSVPRSFDAILDNLLALDREKRPRDIYELISKLGRPQPGKAPWSPWFIGLGMPLFGPLWVGAMTALNWWKLGSPRKAWRPIVVMSIALIVNVLMNVWFPETWTILLSLILIFIPGLGLLIYTDLFTQQRLYREHRALGERSGKLLMPLVFGAVLSIVLMVFNWVDERPLKIYQKGIALYEKHEYDAAIAAFSEAIRLAPDAVEAYNARANAYITKGELEKAAVDYTHVLHLDPKDAVAFHMRGGIFMGKGDNDLAIADCNEAIRIDPTLAAAYLKRGMSYLQKGEPDHAIRDFNDFLRLDPSDSLGYYWRGQAFATRGQIDMALADTTQAIDRDPKSGLSYDQRGKLYLDRSKFDLAVGDYSEAIRIDPLDATAYYERGLAWINKQEYDKAIFDYNQVIRLKPEYADAYFQRGKSWALKNDLDRAVADLSEAIRRDSENPDYIALRGLCFQDLGKLDEAIVDLKAALRLNPPDPQKYKDWLKAAEAAKAAKGR